MKDPLTSTCVSYFSGLRCRVGCFLICACFAFQALASPALLEVVPRGSGSHPISGVEQQVRQMALDGLSKFTASPISRVEVQLGELDSRLRLAPCGQIQPYVPNGSSLWGRTRIGLRCVQGEKAWNVFLSVIVKVMAPALVAAGNLPAGHTLTEADLAQAEVDLAESASAAIHEVALAQGRVLSRALGPSQSLRQSHLKARQWFAMGEVVTVVAFGPGYRVVSQGEALTHGLEGQAARVRMDSGRTLIGTPVANRQVELPL